VEVQPPQVNLLASTSWGVTGVNIQPVALETGLEMKFDAGTGLSGYGGCNTYNAIYGVSGSSLGISAMTQSAAECADPPGIMDLERSFFEALRQTRSYEIVGSELILRDGSGLEVVRGLLRP
jgi:heat shock protein HslJ